MLDIRVTKLVEMKVLQPLNLFPCRSAHNPYRTRRFKRSVRSEADKGYFLVSLRDFFRSRQTINLVISTVFFFDLTVMVEAIQFSVSEAVFVLFGFGCLKNCRQCVAEVHSTDFLSLGRSDLRLVPCSVVAHTAANCEVLTFKVNVLPGQAADLANTKPRVVGNLNGQQRRIVFLFQEIFQLQILFIADCGSGSHMLPKPTLDIDISEFRHMRSLMIKVQDRAREIKHLQDKVLPDLKQQLAETKGIFKGKERKALETQIQQTEREIADKLDKIPDTLKADGYPDAQAFMDTFRKMEGVVEQYNRDLAKWEQQVKEKEKPNRPPEKESVRDRLRQLQAEGKQQRTRKKSQDRER